MIMKNSMDASLKIVLSLDLLAGAASGQMTTTYRNADNKGHTHFPAFSARSSSTSYWKEILLG